MNLLIGYAMCTICDNVLIVLYIIVYTDYIDIEVDLVPNSEYKEEEDPHIYK